MNDIETILSNAGRPDGHGSDPSVVEADVARGRRALTVRRMRRTGTRSVLVGALAIGSFAVVQNQSGHDKAGTTASPAHTAPVVQTQIKTQAPAAKPLSIKLVAYTGTQPKGYTVGSVPSGWEVQGVNNFALAIAPIGFADQDISSWEGKLVVMLESSDQKDTPTGNPVMVGSFHGVVNHDEDNLGPTLYYTDAAGHRVDIQVPAALHWSDAQVAAFGASVHVNATAEAGLG